MEITATINRIGKWAIRIISIIIPTMAIRAVASRAVDITRDSSQTMDSSSSNHSSVAIDSSHISSETISKILDKIPVASTVINRRIVADIGANAANQLFLIQFPYTDKHTLAPTHNNPFDSNSKMKTNANEWTDKKKNKIINLIHTLNEYFVIIVHKVECKCYDLYTSSWIFNPFF